MEEEKNSISKLVLTSFCGVVEREMSMEGWTLEALEIINNAPPEVLDKLDNHIKEFLKDGNDIWVDLVASAFTFSLKREMSAESKTIDPNVPPEFSEL